MDENNPVIYKELQPGTGLCGGKYVIEKKIGEGGFGITYRAMQSGLNRAVCIKEYFIAGGCIRDTYAKTIHLQGLDEDKFEKYRAAFVKEAQTLAALHHPGIVEVIDIFDENNTSYMVMPFIEGRSLQSIVEKDGPLSYPEAVNYIAQVANAVGYIHDRHILHRDIKPDNIMITADYKAVLIDFGSAREFEEDKTQAQTSMVTHGYAPTEQYTRNSRKGAYTDIYAIGATLYFVLTGKVPYEAAARITETMPEPKELNPDLPDEANRTIMKAMQLKSQDRHQSIAEFMDDLRNVKPSQKIETPVVAEATAVDNTTPQESVSPKAEAKPDSKPEAPIAAAVDEKPAKKKSRLLVVVIVVIAVVAVAVALFALFHESPEQREARENISRYESLTTECAGLTAKGDGANWSDLVSAKQLLEDSIVKYEQAYSKVMPDIYCRSSQLRGELEPKLKKAAHGWAESAYTQIKTLDDTSAASAFYTISLRLVDDPAVRLEADMYGCVISDQ